MTTTLPSNAETLATTLPRSSGIEIASSPIATISLEINFPYALTTPVATAELENAALKLTGDHTNRLGAPVSPIASPSRPYYIIGGAWITYN